MNAAGRASRQALGLFLRRRARGLARRHRFHGRARRGRHGDRGALARGLHRVGRHRANVRHHARSRQCGPLPAGQYRARERRGDEGRWTATIPRSFSALSAALACGLAIGIVNYLLIWALRIPPIIATLSASFIIQSIDISYGRGLQIKPPPGFADFTNLQIFGIPVLALLTMVFTLGRRGRAAAHESTAARCSPSGRTRGRRDLQA